MSTRRPSKPYSFLPRNSSPGLIGSIGAGSLFLFSKSKYLIGALKLTKFATLGSMLVTVGAYTAFFGLPYAAGMVSLILIHESGHALMMKKLDIPFSPIVFVPFLGASVAMKDLPKNSYDEALVAFGGPMLGSVGAFSVFLAAQSTQSQLLFALADFGYMINLFNLLPLGMLDGGRICNAISPYSGLVGLGVGGALIYNGHIHNPIFYLVMLAGGWETGKRLWYQYQRKVPGDLPVHYYHITSAERNQITVGYMGLIASLIGAMAFNEKYKKSPRMLEYEQNSAHGEGFQNIYRDY